MPISKGAGAALGGVASGIGGKGAAQSAADAQVQAAQLAQQTQLQMFNQNRADLTPYRNIGAGGLNLLSQQYGLPFGGSGTTVGDTTPGAVTLPATGGGPNLDPYSSILARYNAAVNPIVNQYTGPLGPNGYPQGLQNVLANFKGSPDYQFASQQGLLKANQALNAQGWGGGGGQARGLADYASGLATQNYQNYFNNLNTAASTGLNMAGNQAQMGTNLYSQYFDRLAKLAGIGGGATNQLTNLGAQTAQGIAQNQLQAGQSQASGIVGGYNALAGGLQNASLMPMLYSQSSYGSQPLFGNLFGGGGGGSGSNPYSGSAYGGTSYGGNLINYGG